MGVGGNERGERGEQNELFAVGVGGVLGDLRCFWWFGNAGLWQCCVHTTMGVLGRLWGDLGVSGVAILATLCRHITKVCHMLCHVITRVVW